MEGTIWIILIIIFILINLAGDFPVMICLAGGALFSFIASCIICNFKIEVFTFIISSAVFIVSLIKLKETVPKKTNCDFLIGKLVEVTSVVDKNKGKVYVKGMQWSARSKWKRDIFEKGEIVKITAIKGTKLLVIHRLEEEL